MKQDKEEATKKAPYSGSALVAGSNFKKCVFCQSVDHYSDKCIIVTDIDKRRDLLKRNRICFNCLKGGHIKKNCTAKMKCFKCKTEGHHTALCNSLLKTSRDQASGDDKKDNSVSCLVKITLQYYYKRQTPSPPTKIKTNIAQ